MASFAATLAAVLIWFGLGVETRLDGLLVSARSADLETAVEPDRTIEIRTGSCTLVDDVLGETISVVAPASLRREPQGLRVVQGAVLVSVEKRRPGTPPALILVSHGIIEVLGTRFSVVQGAWRGEVTLHEGEIRFQDLGGGSRPVAAGQRLEWPPPPPSPPAVLSPPSAPESVAPPAPQLPVAKQKRPAMAPTAEPIVFSDPEDLLQQVDVLRSRGFYSEAARYLAHGLNTELPPATRERFSYEFGSILTYRLDDPKAACAHWAAHARRYPAGRYQTEVAQASAHLSCEGSSP